MPCRLALARSLCALLGAAALGACSSNPAIPVLYRVEVQQGNVVTQDMLDRLEPGMDKRKVRFVLGTPLIEDTFNPDRWDYYYSFQDRRKSRTQRRVTLYFEDNQLARIEGDVQPSLERPAPEPSPERVVVVPEREKPGLLAALTPPFLRRDKREDALERSRPEVEQRQTADGETQATGTTAETAADAASGEEGAEAVASLAPATAEDGVSSARVVEESRYFQQLFRGYGRAGPDGDQERLPTELRQPPQEVPAPAPAPATQPEAQVAGSGDVAPEATEEEKGFFSQMVDKLRRERGESPSEEPPAAAPTTEPPGTED